MGTVRQQNDLDQNISVTADLTGWCNQLALELDSAMADLAQTMTAIQDGTYWNSANTQRFGLVTLQFGDQGITERAIERACETCFRAVISSFISFLDKLIASQLVIEEGIVLDRSLAIEEIQEYVNRRFAKKIAVVARDTRLTNPKKLARFVGLSESSRETAIGYFDLRRCLEHHQGIPIEDIRVITWRLKFLTTDGEEIKALHAPLPKGQGLAVGSVRESKIFPAGSKIVLTPEEVHGIVFTLRMVLAPEIFKLHTEGPQSEAAPSIL
jgi:hypothetical protein